MSRTLVVLLGTALLLGLTGCLHEKKEDMNLRLTSVFTAPTEIPGDLTWDGAALWVADLPDATLDRVDVTNGQTTARLPLPVPDLWATGVAWDGEALWVSISLQPTLYRLDPESGQTLREIPLPGEDEPLALAWDGEALWLLTSRQLYRVDAADGRVLLQLPLPGGQVTGLAWDGRGRQLWLAEGSLGLLEALSPQDGHVLASWFLPEAILSPAGLAWDGRTLWLSDEVNGAIYQLRPPKR